MSFSLSVFALSCVYLAVAACERAPALRFRPLPSPRPLLATDLTWYSLAIAASAVSVFVLRPVLTRLEIAPLGDLLGGLPVVVRLALSVVVIDFTLFAVHVAMHRFDALWNIHKVHHSSLHLDALATARTHTLENVLRVLPGQVVLFVAGMPATIVAPAVAITAAYAVSNHSNLRVDPRGIERVLVTPRLHRRHHVPSTTQHNYGTVLTIWDRWFGTLLRADTAPDERYGVPDEIDAYPQRFVPALRSPFRHRMPVRSVTP